MLSKYAPHVLVFLWMSSAPGFTQNTPSTPTVIDSDQALVSFLDHQFLCSYDIYRTEKSTRIKYVYRITNRSEFRDKAIRWHSANIVLKPGEYELPQPGQVVEPIKNDIRFDGDLRPELFDAYRQVGLSGIEIDRIVPGETMTYARESAPCYLPSVDVTWMLFKYGYPPYRWMHDILEKPFEIVQRFFDGEIEVRLSSSVAYTNGQFRYAYSVETNSLDWVFFQWLSTASEDPERLDGFVGEVVQGKAFERKLESSQGPEIVLDVAAINTKGRDLLPVKFLERLSGTSRLQARFVGGSLNQEGRVGTKDLPSEFKAFNSVFLAPSIVVQGSDPSASLRSQ